MQHRSVAVQAVPIFVQHAPHGAVESGGETLVGLVEDLPQVARLPANSWRKNSSFSKALCHILVRASPSKVVFFPLLKRVELRLRLLLGDVASDSDEVHFKRVPDVVVLSVEELWIPRLNLRLHPFG